MSLEATFFSSYPQLILTGMVVLIAQAIYVLFGFGLGLIGVGLLAMFIQPVTNIVVLLLFIALPAEIYVLCKSWKNISWRGIIAIVCGVVGGTIVGTMVLRYGEPDIILTILALFLIVSGIITTTRFISAIYIFPAILLGIWLGNSLHIQISEKRFRKMISIALFIIGIILLAKQWIGEGP